MDPVSKSSLKISVSELLEVSTCSGSEDGESGVGVDETSSGSVYELGLLLLFSDVSSN